VCVISAKNIKLPVYFFFPCHPCAAKISSRYSIVALLTLARRESIAMAFWLFASAKPLILQQSIVSCDMRVMFFARGLLLLLLCNPGGWYLVAVDCNSGRYNIPSAIVHISVTHSLLFYVFDTRSGAVSLIIMI
jgi:hypothetical protein